MASTFVSELDAQAAAVEMPEPPAPPVRLSRLAINTEALTLSELCEPLIRWRDGMIIQRSKSDRDVATRWVRRLSGRFSCCWSSEARCGNQALTRGQSTSWRLML